MEKRLNECVFRYGFKRAFGKAIGDSVREHGSPHVTRLYQVPFLKLSNIPIQFGSRLTNEGCQEIKL